MLLEAFGNLAEALRFGAAGRGCDHDAIHVDALLTSYPKCGRTWLRFALANYFAGKFDLGFAPDLYSMFRILPNFDNEPLRGIPGFAKAAYRSALPLVCVTHLSADAVPSLPLIFLVRDPRDVAISSYFHATRHKQRFVGSISEFVADDRQGLASYIRYLNDWARVLQTRDHHVTSYELMSLDMAAELRKILDFLCIEIDQAVLSEAVGRSSFEAMRGKERQSGLPAHKYNLNDDESLRMRRGVVHGFKGYLTDEMAGEVLKRCRSQLTDAAMQLLQRHSFDPMTDAPNC